MSAVLALYAIITAIVFVIAAAAWSEARWKDEKQGQGELPGGEG